MSQRQPEPWMQKVMDALAASDNRKRLVQIRLFKLYHIRYNGIVSKNALWNYLKGRDYDWMPKSRHTFYGLMDAIDDAVAEIKSRLSN